VPFATAFGDDRLGSLNEITPRRTLEALSLIKPNKNRPPKTYNLGEVQRKLPCVPAHGAGINCAVRLPTHSWTVSRLRGRACLRCPPSVPCSRDGPAVEVRMAGEIR
jgi:hypothetical protein